jgi:hypothetical protein
MKQTYTIAFKKHRILSVLGALSEIIPGAKIIKLSLWSAEVEVPVYEEQSLHYILENEDCVFSKTRTYGLSDKGQA